ncbi:MAG: chemotaxis protein CheW [Holophaga sp.]|jgi:purine-binding chemotaxis protein CheW
MATAELQAKQALEVVPSGQLVTFTLDEVEFGLDIDRVQEITPRTDITPVPGAPSFVLGIINLRGSIIPVLDSRLRFHLQPKASTPKTRIIILDLAGQPTGLMVDSVAEVVKLDDFTLRETPPLVAGVRSDYLAGMVTAANRLITLINLERILDSSEFSQRSQLAERGGEARMFGAGAVQQEVEQVEEDLPYVTFTLGKESFGINLKMVEEIIEIPAVTKVPDAPPYVLGVICLRDQVLPLLDLIQMLHAEPAEQTVPGDMVILLSFGTAKLGIVVDGIQEIIRIREEDILAPPQTLSEREAADLEGVVLRSDRMVSLLKILDIITGEDQAKIAAMSSSLIPERTEDTQAAFELPLVVFHLGSEAYSLRLHEVREIIMVGNITPIPRAPSFIEGVLNLRGEVMPVIDLRERFGLPRQAVSSASRIVITPIGGVSTGLIVDAVDEVKSVDQRRLEDPPRVSAVGANAFIEKVARVDDGVIFLLNVQCLLTEVEGQQLQVFQGKRKG